MFSLQPQVLTSISAQAASVLNSVRTGIFGGLSVKRPHAGRSTRTSQVIPQTVETSQEKTNYENETPLEETLTDLEAQVLEELRPMIEDILRFKNAENPVWISSHVSADTFFENKTGFPEKELYIDEPDFYHHRYVPKLLCNTAKNIFLEQRRGFRTRRTKDFATGHHDPSDMLHKESEASVPKTSLGSIFSSSNTTDHTHKVAEKRDLSHQYVEHLKSELEQYKTKDTWANRSAKYFKYFVYISLSVYLLNLILRTAPGDVRDTDKGGLGKILGGHTFEIAPENVHTTFKDVKGVDEAREELEDVVEFLKNPDKFSALGAKLPKGVLLVGPPGIGKTLLARAVAGEAGVPFFYASGSEFDELFVGTGAKRVRRLFSDAKRVAPCLVFIDEIDTVAAKRTSSTVHPYANQTVNQLLAEMDGFAKNEGIIVLGATNRRDHLDKALLRPGRFDVEVNVMPPDLKGRMEIFKLYLEKTKPERRVDIEKLARGTTGFTGADIENMVNQAAILAVQDGSKLVSMTHLDAARDKILMGPAKKNKIPDEEVNLMTAYHEAGHTIVAYYTKDATPLHKVTIVARGQSLGHTSFMEEKDVYNRTKSQLMAQMDVGLGGRVAEEIIYGPDKVTTGAGSDFRTATNIATSVVKEFGMSEKVGVRSITDSNVEVGLGAVKVTDISPALQEVIDGEVKRLLEESYSRAKSILQSKSKELKALAAALMKYETLDKEEIALVLSGKDLNRPQIDFDKLAPKPR